jgi:hypothetical protein
LTLDDTAISSSFLPRDKDGNRLVNCALMPKIHTVEWTPAILVHPALQIRMTAN